MTGDPLNSESRSGESAGDSGVSAVRAHPESGAEDGPPGKRLRELSRMLGLMEQLRSM